MRTIKLDVSNEYLQGAGVVIGAEGSSNDVILQLTFAESWDGLSKYATFTDAKGEGHVVVTLGVDLLEEGTTDTYNVPVPARAKLYEGKSELVITGYTVVNGTEQATATNTTTGYFRVLPADYSLADDGSIDATLAEQFQSQIDTIKEKIGLQQAEEAEAWAVGTMEGVEVPETDERYHNNSKYYAQQAASSESTATSAKDTAVSSSEIATGAATELKSAVDKINADSARIDSFTKLAEGSTTGDAELIDGRVGEDGATYTNIGGAIRGQIGDLKEDLSSASLTSNYSVSNAAETTLLENSTVGTNDGAITTNAGFYSVRHKIPDNAKYMKQSNNFGYAAAIFYTSDMTYLYANRIINLYAKIPSTAAYVAYIICKDTAHSGTHDYVAGDEKAIFFCETDYTEAIESAFNVESDVDLTVEKGTVRYTDGVFFDSDTMYRCAYAKIGVFTNRIYAPRNTNGYFSFYKGITAKTFISSSLGTVTDDGGFICDDIPEEASYYSFNVCKIDDYKTEYGTGKEYRIGELAAYSKLVKQSLLDDTKVEVPYTVETGAILYETGAFITNDNYYRASYKMIRNGMRGLLIPAISNGYVCFYDSSKTFISYVAAERINGYYLVTDIPSGSVYYAFIISSITAYNDNYGKGYEFNKGSIISELDSISDEVGTLSEQSKQFFFNNPISVRITDFDDSSLTDDEIISNALSFANRYAKRTIIFDGRDFNISQSILLNSYTNVVIDGITIKQNDETFDTVFRGNNITLDADYPNGFAASIDSDLYNISITGKNGAVISGPDVNKKDSSGNEMVGGDYGWRCIQVLFTNVHNFELSGISFVKTRCWATSFEFSSNLKIHDLDFNTTCPNGDGVDIRTGCHDVEIYNISGITMDDVVACTNVYGQTLAYPAALEKQEYSMEIAKATKPNKTIDELTIHDITIHDITAVGRYHQFICCSAGLLPIRNISVYDCSVDSNPSSLRLDAQIQLYGSNTYYDYGPYNDNDIRDISINNIETAVYPYVLKTDVKILRTWANKLKQNNSSGDISSISYADGVTITNSSKAS